MDFWFLLFVLFFSFIFAFCFFRYFFSNAQNKVGHVYEIHRTFWMYLFFIYE